MTDPAGNWKTYTKDVFGNLTIVTEPNPNSAPPAYSTCAGGAATSNYVSCYTYNGVGQLTNVELDRDGKSQTRTFQWGGKNLLSATNPENGTTSYTYDPAGRVLTRIDAKSQVTSYAYDTYGRLTSVEHFAPGNYPGNPDPVQKVTFYYDSYNGMVNNTWGRLAAVQFGNDCPGDTALDVLYLYTYGYSAAGRVTNQGMQVSVNQSANGNYTCAPYTVSQTASFYLSRSGSAGPASAEGCGRRIGDR
ncbi:MAG TPA: hypothetical protein VKV17_15930 [Bryobacteraceae bacterium]|nr:hypothetical protein [Bryobacteraceae bacterium]